MESEGKGGGGDSERRQENVEFLGALLAHLSFFRPRSADATVRAQKQAQLALFSHAACVWITAASSCADI